LNFIILIDTYYTWDELDEESTKVPEIIVVPKKDLNFVRIDEYLKFTNFQFYLISPDSETQFLTLYGVLAGLLLVTIGVLFVSS
jgi:hypothetical protein